MDKFKAAKILESDENGEQWVNMTKSLTEDEVCYKFQFIILKLDVSSIEADYCENGQNAYAPRTLLGIIFFGYSQGVRSGGALSDRCRYDIRYKMLAEGHIPCKSTINKFRSDHYGKFKDLFVQFLGLLKEKGLLNTIDVFGDGTILKANASKKRTKTKEQYTKWLAKLNEDIVELKADENKKVELAKKKRLAEKVANAVELLSSAEDGARLNLTDHDAKMMKGKKKPTKQAITPK